MYSIQFKKVIIKHMVFYDAVFRLRKRRYDQEMFWAHMGDFCLWEHCAEVRMQDSMHQ